MTERLAVPRSGPASRLRRSAPAARDRRARATDLTLVVLLGVAIAVACAAWLGLADENGADEPIALFDGAYVVMWLAAIFVRGTWSAADGSGGSAAGERA